MACCAGRAAEAAQGPGDTAVSPASGGNDRRHQCREDSLQSGSESRRTCVVMISVDCVKCISTIWYFFLKEKLNHFHK